MGTAALAHAACVSQRLVQDLVTGVERKFTPATCLALDAALGLPTGTVAESVGHRNARLIREAPYPQSQGEWLAQVLADGGCVTPAREIQAAGRSLLRHPDPAVRDLGLAALAVARELPADDWRDRFGRGLASRDGLTRADRIVLGEAADRRAGGLGENSTGDGAQVNGRA